MTDADVPAEPRIAPLTPAERSDEVNELLSSVALTGPTDHIFTTLARHPGLFRRWLPLGGKLLAGKLPARDRELLILRTAWRCRAEYEWGQHVPLGQRAGLSDEEIARVRRDDETWDELDAALIDAVDELHDDSRLTDATWERLAAHYDEKQLIEIPMVVGHYHMVAYALNTFGVQLEPGVRGFDG